MKARGEGGGRGGGEAGGRGGMLAVGLGWGSREKGRSRATEGKTLLLLLLLGVVCGGCW